ncbi:MAG: aldo/keto reductase [Algibacter sp.]|uniref:aldo/keto reductase n=1 Tax=Algibacter sp. TaxID=1872428 RepID=UPI002602EAF1|nr:aldo/keto reductase [Algibacter sp.]MDG1728992.1 aldo/keto reductase [Algibacter sp.]MDG2179564.1 aldo/keto reductase [Algibacter sp.]
MKKKSKTKIGLGLAALGRPEYINIRTDNSIDKSEEAFKSNTFSVLDKAYKLGIRYFDTAPSYGKGEAFLKEWHDKNSHSDVVLGTKWGYTYVANWELGFEGKHEVKEHSLKKLLQQWQVSKYMLPKLKYYQVHSATFESGILENEAVLNQLQLIKKETGLHIGMTTSGANQKEVIEAALKVKVNNEPLFESFQVTYNIFEQSPFSILKDVLKQGKKVIIKEALANGRVFQNEKFQHYSEAYKILNQLSKKYEVGFDAIALRFVMDRLEPTYVLSGASNKRQLTQNLKALNFNFTIEELKLFETLKVVPEAYWKERSALSWN